MAITIYSTSEDRYTESELTAPFGAKTASADTTHCHPWMTYATKLRNTSE